MLNFAVIVFGQGGDGRHVIVVFTLQSWLHLLSGLHLEFGRCRSMCMYVFSCEVALMVVCEIGLSMLIW